MRTRKIRSIQDIDTALELIDIQLQQKEYDIRKEIDYLLDIKTIAASVLSAVRRAINKKTTAQDSQQNANSSTEQDN